MPSTFRVIKFSLQDILRNFSLSFMTVLILLLMLLSVNTLIIVRVITEESINTVKDQIDVSVYFNADSTDEEIQEVRNYISGFPEVTEENFLNRDTVLSNFKKTYADNAQIIASLDELGENPLGPTLILKTREPKDYEKIITALSVPEYETIIEAKTFADTQTAIDRIHVITTQVERFTYFLTALFAIIAFVIIFNTIRVAIYTQRTEISIKRLVGATSWFIRGPYIMESLIFSVISVMLTIGIVYGALTLVDPYVAIIFGKTNLLHDYFATNLVNLTLLQFVAVFVLTALSSGLAMGRYLRT